MSWRKFINLEILRFAQDDVKGVQYDKPCVIASVAKQSQHELTSNRLLRRFTPRNDVRVLKECAFTLSEVLIVLAVLGVVAAITIPDLVQDYREKALITALKKNYSIFEQAIEMAQVDNGPIAGWGVSNSLEFYNILKPYLKIEEDCGLSRGCLANHYGALFGDDWWTYPHASSRYAKGVLISGMSFYIWHEGCGRKYCGYIGVDVNGKAAPNRAGVDFFVFVITKDGLEPAGRSIYIGEQECEYNNYSSQNGVSCTWWAIKHENMDYLRKAGKYTNY